MTFSKDLLRRRVPQVVAVYLGACWGLLEFTDFITQRFALSPHLIDLALVLPLLLLPSLIIVTYFHGAPGQDEWVRAEKIGIPLNLVAAGVFLVFFFQGKDLGATTTKVVVTDEEGVETERVVPKVEFRKRLAVFFFNADPADTAAGWIRYGLPVAIAVDLTQDEFIDLRTPPAFADRLREAGFEEMVGVPFSLEREIAEELHRDHFVTGSVNAVDGKVQATVALYDAPRGRLVEERTFTGTDVLALADEISTQLREDLKIPDLGEEGAPDLPVSEVLTNSSRAYRLSIEAMVAIQVDRDYSLGTSLMESAVADDPTYADAQDDLASLFLLMNRSGEIAGPMQAAMDHIYRLPERSRFVLKSNYYLLVRQDMEKAAAALDMWADLFPDDLLAYQARLQIQTLRDDRDGALASLEKILELDPAQRDVLLQIGDLHESMGDFAAAEGAFQAYAEEFPENPEVLARLAELSRRSGDLDRARQLYDRALILAPSDVGLLVGLGTLEQAAGDFQAALTQFEEAMGTADTPEERSQVYSAFESYYRNRGQIGRAIEYMEERLAEGPSYLPLFLAAQYRLTGAGTYAEAGRMDDAFALVEEARGRLPSPFDLMTPIGEMQIYMAVEDADGIESTLPGVEGFIQALQYEILRPAVVRAQGMIHELRGEYGEAMERYEEERRLNPSSFSVFLRLGRCHRELREYDEAVSLLQDALRANPFGPQASYELALVYEDMGRLEDARTHLDNALEVWAEADPSYLLAQRAREAAQRMGR